MRAMKPGRLAVALALAAAVVLAAAAPASAKTFKRDGVTIDDPYTRPSPRVQDVPAPATVFLRIDNKSGKDLQLLGAESPVAGQVEVQQLVRAGKQVRTRRVLQLMLSQGDTADMTPGGEYRLLLVGLKKKLQDGETFPLELELDPIGKIEVTVEVRYEVYTETGPRQNQRARPPD